MKTVQKAKKVAVITAAAFMASVMAGCSSGPTQADIGTISGGIIGGLVGSQFGGGSGQVAAAAAGAVIGSYIGGKIGKSMDDVDRMKAQNAVARTPTGQSTSWTNPDNGNRYTVQPTKTYYRNDQPCREYTTTAIIGGKKQEIYGTACRMADGSWKTVS